MVSGVVARAQLPWQWLVADEHYGMNPAFTDGIAGLGKWYFVEVPKNTMVWPARIEIIPPGQGPMGAPRKGPCVAPGTPSAKEVQQLAVNLKWKCYTIKEGKGQSLPSSPFCARQVSADAVRVMRSG